jgi:hypothetical protein
MSAVRQVAFRLKSDGKAEVQRDFKDVGDSGAKAYAHIEQAAIEASHAADRQMAKYREMAKAAEAAGRAADVQRRYNTLLGVDATVGKSARSSAEAFMQGPGRGLSAMQRNTLVYTVSDVFASAASGMNPAMIAMQQGPQVLQAFIVEGGKAAATMMRLGVAIGVPAAAVGLLTGAYLSHREASRQLEISVSGIGAASGESADSLRALADANRDAGQLTAGAARDMAGAYAETGRIGGEVIGRLIAETRSYATVTRQDAKGATAELAKAFADPAKGAEVLNGKLGLLDDGTLRYIQTLIEQNRTTEAQLVLADSLSRRLETAAGNVSVLGGAWDVVKRKAADAWEWMGKAVDRALGGGPALQRIQDLTLERAVQAQVPFGLGNRRVQEIDAELAKIRSDEAARERQAAQTRANQIAADARAAQDRVNPLPGRLRELRADEAKIKGALDIGALVDTVQAQKDLEALRKEIKAVEAGYSSASAQASALGRQSRSAASDARKAAREAERDAKEAERQAKRLLDLQTRDQIALARAQDNKFLVEELEREARLRSLTNDYESAGLSLTRARLVAQQQVSLETKAEFETRRKLLTEVPRDFVSTQDALKRHEAILAGANDNVDAAKAMQGAYESAFDRIGDMLASGETDWSSYRDAGKAAINDIIGEMLRLAAINPLKNALFGQANPTLGSGGLLGALFGKGGSKAGILPGDQPAMQLPERWNLGGGSILGSIFGALRIPGFAAGTDYAPGGWAEVGEHGRELVRLPRGSQVFNAQRTAAMSKGGDVTVPISIHVDAQGAGPREVDAIVARLDQFERDFPGRVVAVVTDARERRWM